MIRRGSQRWLEQLAVPRRRMSRSGEPDLPCARAEMGLRLKHHPWVGIGSVAFVICLSLTIGGCAEDGGLRPLARQMESSKTMDAEAARLCNEWIKNDWGKPEYILIGAKDSSLGELRATLRAAGVINTQDTLLSSDRQGYVALCLSHPPEDRRTRVLTYQLRDGQGGALAGWKG